MKFKMKSVFAFTMVVLIGSTLVFTGCGKKDNTVTLPPKAFTQKCVVEKYTGEWCGACPNAGSFFETMTTTYPTKFIGVAIHAGSPDRYASNASCQSMYSYLTQELKHPSFSGTIGFPNVMIMRSANPSNGAIIDGFGSSEWTGAVSNALAVKAPLGLSLETKVLGTTLSSTAKYQISTALPAGVYALTAYLVENELDGSLQTSAPAGYKQQHVLRELLTPKEGLTIDATKMNIPVAVTLNDVSLASYVAANCQVIAFIHKKGTSYDDKKIINGQIVKAGFNQNFD